jgi:hypothetical protein
MSLQTAAFSLLLVLQFISPALQLQTLQLIRQLLFWQRVHAVLHHHLFFSLERSGRAALQGEVLVAHPDPVGLANRRDWGKKLGKKRKGGELHQRGRWVVGIVAVEFWQVEWTVVMKIHLHHHQFQWCLLNEDLGDRRKLHQCWNLIFPCQLVQMLARMKRVRLKETRNLVLVLRLVISSQTVM